MRSVDVVLLVLLLFPYFVNGNDELLKQIWFKQIWINKLDADPWVEQTGCKLQQTENEVICGGVPSRDKGGLLMEGSMTRFTWQVDGTEMKDRRGDDTGTFALHIGVPSFKPEEPSNSFQCARVQYKVLCKAESGQADCKAMWADASSGMKVASGGATNIYLVAGQVVNIVCDVMLADARWNVWRWDSRVEVKLEIRAAFIKTGESMFFNPDHFHLSKTLISGAKFTMLSTNDPDKCRTALNENMQYMALKTEASTINSATVRLWKGIEQQNLMFPGGCEGCIETEITHPIDKRAVLPLIDCKITDVQVVTGDTTQPPEVLLGSAFLGPPRLDVESSFFPEFLRDVVIDPARLPPETKDIIVTVNRIVEGYHCQGFHCYYLSTKASIPIVGATGSALIGLSVAVILLSITVAGLLVMLWRIKNKPPHLVRDTMEMGQLHG